MNLYSNISKKFIGTNSLPVLDIVNVSGWSD